MTVKDTTSQLHIGVNEGYSLNTVNSVVELSADTRFGVVRGLETFYQLYNATGQSHFVCNFKLEINI